MSGPVYVDDQSQERIFEQVSLLNLDAGTKRVLSADWVPSGAGGGSPQVKHWSADGSSVFIAYHALPDGCPGFGVDGNLRRVELRDGRMIPLDARLYGVISVSPEENRIAAVGFDQVVLYDIMTEHLRAVEFDSGSGQTASGNVIWSEAGDAFVFQTDFGYCGDEAAISVWMVDVEGEEVLPITIHHDGRYTLERWEPNGRVRMQNAIGERFWLNLSSGEILSHP